MSRISSVPWALVAGLAAAALLALGCPEPAGSAHGDDDAADDDDIADDDAADDDTGDDDSAGDDDTAGDDDDSAPFESDLHIDFVAAAPMTYNHLTGGGAYNDGTFGIDEDVIESLMGGDFACGDVVTFLTMVTVDESPSHETLTLELEYDFAANSTGHPGAGHGDVTQVKVNYGVVENGAGPGGIDAGIADDGGSTATLIDEWFDPLNSTLFVDATNLRFVLQVDDLEAAETVVIRIDSLLMCDPAANPGPTGSVHARLEEPRITAANGQPVDPPYVVPGGDQNVPLLQVGNIDTDPD